MIVVYFFFGDLVRFLGAISELVKTGARMRGAVVFEILREPLSTKSSRRTPKNEVIVVCLLGCNVDARGEAITVKAATGLGGVKI